MDVKHTGLFKEIKVSAPLGSCSFCWTVYIFGWADGTPGGEMPDRSRVSDEV